MKLSFIKFVKTLFEGLSVVFKHLFRKPVTLEYPEKKKEMNEHFRGKLKIENCVGCKICQKVCPTGAISMTKNDEGKVISYKIDLRKCIFCGNCTFYCPHKSIKMTKEYELADILELVYMEGEENVH